MDIISKQFLSLYPVKDINFEVIFATNLDYYQCEELQQSLLQHSLHHPRALQYPPHTSYKRHFLKSLIAFLENSSHEVCSELYSSYAALLSECNSTEETFYRSYSITNTLITLKESRSLISDGTTGLRTWQASHVLLTHVRARPHLVAGKDILELGCGLGHFGLCLLASFSNISEATTLVPPASYCFSDQHPSVLQTLHHNLNINLLPSSPKDSESDVPTVYTHGCVPVTVRSLDWEEVTLQDSFACDVVLAADVVFDPRLHDPLLTTITACLNQNNKRKQSFSLSDCAKAPPQKVAVLALTVRNEEALQCFISSIGSHGLHIAESTEEFYQESPSQLQHCVKVLHLSK